MLRKEIFQKFEAILSGLLLSEEDLSDLLQLVQSAINNSSLPLLENICLITAPTSLEPVLPLRIFIH